MSIKREGHDDAVFFVGSEIETTPAAGMKTLFVVGVRSISHTIELAREHHCKHVYLGANRSFQKNKAWNEIIPALLAEGLRVTLDYPAEAQEYVVDLLLPEIVSHPYFIPMISCVIPHVENFNRNLVIKIDDVDFKGTNSGVWCISASELLDRNRFTDWKEYVEDVVLVRDSDIKALRAAAAKKKEE
jgi:hypothetical protein